MEIFNKTGSVPFYVGDSRTKDEIEESAIWQNINETKMLQFTSAIAKMTFSPLSPHNLVVLSGISGPCINGKTKTQDFAYAKTKSPFSAVTFRKDGVLIALGRQDGTIDIYPTKNHQNLLKRNKLNCGIIFSVQFSPFENTIVAGCGDGTIRIIDVAQVDEEIVINAHNDAVTSVLPLDSGNIWVSCSNDAKLKVWNLNTQTEISCIEAPVPISGIVTKGRRIFAACGESVLFADISSTISKTIKPLHTRQIVDMCIVRSNLVTASADRTIKITDPSSFAILYQIKVHSDIIAFTAMPDASRYAVAFPGGVVQLKYAKEKIDNSGKDNIAQLPANVRVFSVPKMKKNTRWNKLLTKFEFTDALDSAIAEDDPAIGVGMIDELDKIGGLEAAIAGRDSGGVQPLLRFLIKNVSNPSWSSVIHKAVITFIRIYRHVISDVPAIGKMFDELSEKIGEELMLQREAANLVGKIDLIIS